MKSSPDIRRLGLIANTDKPAAAAVLRRAAALIQRAGRQAIADAASASLARLSVPTAGDARALAAACDVVLVFGGDGTMLRVARELNGSRTPILGINIGGLGFLTAVSSDATAAALRKLWNGTFSIEARPLIEAAVGAGRARRTHVALNDFVVSRGAVPRLIQLDVHVDDEALTRYRCDGLIISSPTGSTAYSLAAGGAIVSPRAEVFALTPICPHTLSNRSVIVGLDSAVRVKVLGERADVILAGDGHTLAQLTAGDEVLIRRSRRAVRLVHLGHTSFYQTLRRKLHWSGSHV